MHSQRPTMHSQRPTMRSQRPTATTPALLFATHAVVSVASPLTRERLHFSGPAPDATSHRAGATMPCASPVHVMPIGAHYYAYYCAHDYAYYCAHDCAYYCPSLCLLVPIIMHIIVHHMHIIAHYYAFYCAH